ncbi:UDP-N-acetylmuramate--L-alanine ligase, partial [bacterium]|nr:UDP-N-acetylmuramate--L-alanine ligase [bacterium]
MFGKIRKIHFVGIGGIGMSGIAELLLIRGYKISGSDAKLSPITERLASLGAKIYEGHNSENVKDAEVVVYSSAVSEENPELVLAREKFVPTIKRAEMLGELMRMKFGIGIAGTHGKTTTTSMTGLVLSKGNFDPTIIVGGIFKNLGTNQKAGDSQYLVVEADEFDRTFLSLTPSIAVITTLEAEHLDCYTDLEDIKGAFTEFANKVPFYGAVIACLDEVSVQDILPKIKKRKITYGVSAQADYQCLNVSFNQSQTSFDVKFDGKILGKVNLNVPGLHNVKNSLASIAVGIEMGLTFEEVSRSLTEFNGVMRRFEIKGTENGITVVDDYAHHPTEIEATLKGARTGWQEKRIVAVFQPHLYTRTRDFASDFGRA